MVDQYHMDDIAYNFNINNSDYLFGKSRHNFFVFTKSAITS